jgi:hypothetical protein
MTVTCDINILQGNTSPSATLANRSWIRRRRFGPLMNMHVEKLATTTTLSRPASSSNDKHIITDNDRRRPSLSNPLLLGVDPAEPMLAFGGWGALAVALPFLTYLAGSVFEDGPRMATEVSMLLVAAKLLHWTATAPW